MTSISINIQIFQVKHTSILFNSLIFNDKKVKDKYKKNKKEKEISIQKEQVVGRCMYVSYCPIVSDRNAFNHCCLSYISRACNNMEIVRLVFVLSVDEQRKTFRAKYKELYNDIKRKRFQPGFDPANVREKLPDDNSGILTPSSISSIRKN
jgi:hypothetical protein